MLKRQMAVSRVLVCQQLIKFTANIPLLHPRHLILVYSINKRCDLKYIFFYLRPSWYRDISVRLLKRREAVRFLLRGKNIFNIYISFTLVRRQSAALNSGTQHTMPANWQNMENGSVLINT